MDNINPAEKRPILLKNGYIVDGTGKKSIPGSVLIKDGKIECISQQSMDGDFIVYDCSSKFIAPGFIDAHSHNDWYMPSKNAVQFTSSFISQGITTFIAGNCGFSPFGLKKGTSYMDKIHNNLFKSADIDIQWSTVREYHDMLEGKGLTANMANLVGHGTSRASIRGYSSRPLNNDEMKELLYLLDESMEQGALGVSLGLQYEPGIFSTMDELAEVAKLVKRRGKVLTVHAKASSALSGTYPLKLFGKPHHILALEDMINLAKSTGVRLQFSHLIFVGEKTWKTYEKTLDIMDRAIADGVDIKFDTYAYSCGASVISVVLPEWFMAKVPGAYSSKSDLMKLKIELNMIKTLLGFGYGDIQIAYANDPELNKYNGMFISDISKEMGISEFDTYIELARRSNGKARVMQYKYSNDEIVEALIRHPASIFMTDAWMEIQGTQNPSCFGCFPRFLQVCRDKNILPVEAAVYKMTLAGADRFGIKDRGRLEEGLPADITVFDWNNVRDNTIKTRTDAPPSGIEHVFINGIHVLDNGMLLDNRNPGNIIK